MPTYRCAICDAEIEHEQPGLPALYPFCSRRCKLIDLGLWFREAYAIDRDLTPDDADLPPEHRP